MKRRIIGLVALIVGAIFILLYTTSTINLQVDSYLDYITMTFLLVWAISSLLVKVGMIFNRKESLINLSSFVLLGCLFFLGLLAGGDQETNLSLVDLKTALMMNLTYTSGLFTSGLLFLTSWAGIDFYDFKYLSPTPKK